MELEQFEQTVEKWFEKVKEEQQKKKKPDVYRPRKTTIAKIGKANVTHLKKELDYCLRSWVRFRRIDMQRMFEQLMGNIKLHAIRLIPEAVREEIYMKLEEVIERVPFDSVTLELVYDREIHLLRERVKLITEGKDVTNYHFIDSAKEQEIYATLRKAILLVFREKLYLVEEIKVELENLKIDLVLFERPLLSIKRFIARSNLELSVGKNTKLLEEKIKHWYINTNQTFVEPFLAVEQPVDKINDYVYLLTDEQKQEQFVIALINLQKEYEQLKAEEQKGVDVMHSAQMLRQNLRKIKKWRE